MLKNKLRFIYKNRRSSISDDSLTHQSRIITNAISDLPIWHLNYFHIFLPIARLKEINTHLIISMLRSQNKQIVVPKVVGDGVLKHYIFTETTELFKNTWNVLEPLEGTEVAPHKIDVVFVPLLAFDRIGNRVGYGKGFYDRFLRDCKKDAIKIGLSLFDAEEIIDDIDEFDISLNYCVTPQKIYSF